MTAGVREKRGHYTAAMLREGYRDQYAVLRRRGKVVVELYYDEENSAPFVVATIVTSEGRCESTERTYKELDEARKGFRRIVRQNP